MDSLKDFLGFVQNLGTAGGPIFAILWWMERKERKEKDASGAEREKAFIQLGEQVKMVLGMINTLLINGSHK